MRFVRLTGAGGDVEAALAEFELDVAAALLAHVVEDFAEEVFAVFERAVRFCQ